MFTPPYTVTDNALSLLVEIGRLLPRHEAGPPTPEWNKEGICHEHARLGGDGRYRTDGRHPHWIPVLMAELLEWARCTTCHPLIRGAVLHYELMSILPFSSGNDSLATLIHQSLLAAYHPRFESLNLRLPTEDYNRALAAPDASELITLSLHAILGALKKPTHERSRATRRQSAPEQLLNYLRRHPGSKRGDIMTAHPSISPRMLDRHLQALKDSGQIEYRGSRKTGAYYPAVATR